MAAKAETYVNKNLTFLRENYLKYRILACIGGTRSGKTYSIIQFLIELCYTYINAGMVITIVRSSFPALRGSVYKDFIDILISINVYSEENHNKTEHIYKLLGNEIEFISLDQPQKVRGRKRDILFCNEVNEINKEGWRQLLYRTEGPVIVDFNPSMPIHWIYEELDRKDATQITTTYKDNPFLSEYQVTEIERLKDVDPMRWRVYGLGQRGSYQLGQIFIGWQQITLEEYDSLPYNELLGLDWGFSNDPCAVVGVKYHNRKRYYRKYIYQTELGNNTLASRIPKNKLVIADSAEPKSIVHLKKLGVNIKPARKGQDSINFGINAMKENENYYVSDSDFELELSNYCYQINSNEEILDKPIDSFNHIIDAARYVELFIKFKPAKIKKY